jgi:hypothetical protein
MAYVFRAETRLPAMSRTDEKSNSITDVNASKHLRRDVWYVVTEDIRVIINEHDGIEYDEIYFNTGLQNFFVHAHVY